MPSMDPHRDRSAGPPVMPSFASLRGPTRRSPVDVLLPGEPPAAPPPPPPAQVPRPARPPEWADLLHLAVHLAGAVAAVPTRVIQRLFRP